MFWILYFVIMKILLVACALREKRVINGIKVGSGESAKYSVFIHGKEFEDEMGPWKWMSECSGSIIDEQYVLTAAHCIIQENSTHFRSQPVIIPGVINAYAKKNKRFEVEVARAYVPKEFEWIGNFTPSIAGDIAVLKLTKKLDLGSSLVKLNLPWTRNDKQFVIRNKKGRLVTMQSYLNYAGEVALVAGYGAHDTWYEYYDDEPYQFWNSTGQLYKLHLTVLSKDEAGKFPGWCLPKQEYICAVPHPYYKDAGICNGDSGSPLVLNNTIIGVLINSPQDCRDYDEYPAQFTRVSYYIGFIKNAVNDKVKSSMRVHVW